MAQNIGRELGICCPDTTDLLFDSQRQLIPSNSKICATPQEKTSIFSLASLVPQYFCQWRIWCHHWKPTFFGFRIPYQKSSISTRRHHKSVFLCSRKLGHLSSFTGLRFDCSNQVVFMPSLRPIKYWVPAIQPHFIKNVFTHQLERFMTFPISPCLMVQVLLWSLWSLKKKGLPHTKNRFLPIQNQPQNRERTNKQRSQLKHRQFISFPSPVQNLSYSHGWIIREHCWILPRLWWSDCWWSVQSTHGTVRNTFGLDVQKSSSWSIQEPSILLLCCGIKISYLGFKDHYPVIEAQIFQKKYPRRYAQAMNENIVVAGMSKTLEAAVAPKGVLCGKSAVLIQPNPGICPYALTVLLNSMGFGNLYRGLFAMRGMSGTSLNIGPRQIEQLPVPESQYLQIYAMPSVQTKTFYQRLQSTIVSLCWVESSIKTKARPSSTSPNKPFAMLWPIVLIPNRNQGTEMSFITFYTTSRRRMSSRSLGLTNKVYTYLLNNSLRESPACSGLRTATKTSNTVWCKFLRNKDSSCHYWYPYFMFVKPSKWEPIRMQRIVCGTGTAWRWNSYRMWYLRTMDQYRTSILGASRCCERNRSSNRSCDRYTPLPSEERGHLISASLMLTKWTTCSTMNLSFIFCVRWRDPYR